MMFCPFRGWKRAVLPGEAICSLARMLSGMPPLREACGIAARKAASALLLTAATSLHFIPPITPGDETCGGRL